MKQSVALVVVKIPFDHNTIIYCLIFSKMTKLYLIQTEITPKKFFLSVFLISFIFSDNLLANFTTQIYT